MELSRRGFLGTALGTALAALGCRARPPTIGGAIVGGAAARGHLLRGGPLPPVRARGRASVVICGGGIAGLAAAWTLQRAGVDDLVVLELEDAVGGTALGGRNSTSAYPWGAHYVPVPTRRARAACALLQELGAITDADAGGRAVPAPEHLCRAPQERLFYRGFWTAGSYLRDGASARDLAEYDRFHARVAELADRRDAAGRRPFDVPVAASSPDAAARALDGMSMRDWLAREGFTSPRLLWYVEYATRDDFGCLLPDTSAWAGLHYFAARLGDEGDAAEFLTWPEGNARLVAQLAGGLGERRRTGAVVTRVSPTPGGATVTYGDVAADHAVELDAAHVICALPRFVATHVVEGLPPAPTFRYSPWVVANLTLDRPAASHGAPLCWDNVLVESESLGYVVATHQSDRPERDTVWTWYRPFCGPDVRAAREAILAADWAHWRDAVLADLGRAHPDLRERVQHLDVWRWGHGMVRPEPGFLWGGAREAALASRGRVHFAGADLGGLPLFEEAQWTGVRAAEAVLTAMGRPFDSLL